ncbi:MAG TPA: response regulator transcription factor [Candidatus Acidoferrales bacterium]
MALRVFIADDSDFVSSAIKTLLVSHSSEWLVCGEAADGDQAIVRATETVPDIILLDLSLPQASGASVATRLRNAIPTATIVLMSAQDPGVLRHLADSVGVDYYVPKSNLGTDLITTLNSIARTKQSSS